jgi:DNA-binding beta-propeller fold protein YncE
MQIDNILQKPTRFGIGLIVLFTFLLAGCGGGGGGSSGGGSADWYYHWNCNGDYECLTTNSAGTPSGTTGPISGGQVGCNELMTFGTQFWGIPPATQSCDNSSTTPTPILSLRSITVTPANKFLGVGSTQQYVATASYSDGTSADVTAKATWSAGNGVICGTVCVATISPSGMATTYAIGSITIKATQGVISGSTTLYVTAATLQSIAVTPTNPSIHAGLAEYFRATGTYSDGTTQDLSYNATWTSGTPTVATMSTNKTVCGQVCVVYPDIATGVSPGTSVITATSGSISGNTTLTVTAATLVSISVIPTNPTVASNFTRQLTAIGHYSNGTTLDITSQVTWSSATTSVAIVGSATGIVSGVAAGTSTITATLGSISASTTLTVTASTLVSISAITPPIPICILNASIQLSATGNFSDGSSYILPTGLTWSSNTPSIATVYSSGVATCVALGTSTITATSGTVSGSIILTVRAAPRYAYVANYSDNTISQYTIGATGALTANGAAVATGTAPFSVTVDPTGKYAYVANNLANTISQYTIGTTGALTANGAAVATGTVPISVTVDPTGKYAYVTNDGDNTVSQYTIGATGALTANGAAVATGAYPWSVTVDPTGKYAYVTNDGDNTVSQYSIDGTGALTANGAAVATGANPRSIVVPP